MILHKTVYSVHQNNGWAYYNLISSNGSSATDSASTPWSDAELDEAGQQVMGDKSGESTKVSRPKRTTKPSTRVYGPMWLVWLYSWGEGKKERTSEKLYPLWTKVNHSFADISAGFLHPLSSLLLLTICLYRTMQMHIVMVVWKIK